MGDNRQVVCVGRVKKTVAAFERLFNEENMIVDFVRYQKLINRLSRACERFEFIKAWEIADRWYVWATKVIV